MWVYLTFNILNVFSVHKVVLPRSQNTEVPLMKENEKKGGFRLQKEMNDSTI